ncbi:MAG TPA: phosphoheptose isomerase [Patescibacteria group bacterium]|jgi:mannose-6-phosphate isomerase-like protein (cupin superfamily)
MVEQKTLSEAEKIAADAGVKVVDRDLERPWGGFLVFGESEVREFATAFFPKLELPGDDLKRSPKLLIVGPGERLSWQFHHRRSEHWHVLRGPVGVAVSETDDEVEPRVLQEGEEVEIVQGERHRLIGLDSWGIVAEIWTHTDPEHPSDEDDIVRLADDYARETPAESA